ncbi:MAG TPA: phosphate acyltransferase PlsX [Thermomicrobiales bacterium]|nr:phosphate acyltransferase PlsX [Thermomicrobiales bacterium]
MRIALDAHGGDVGISRNVSAVIETLDETRHRIVLVGIKSEIEAELKRRSVPLGQIDIVHAEEMIGMGDAAVQSVRRKAHNSINVAMQLARSGDVDAVVSAGHSGAVVASALITLGRIPGVTRPALGTRIPATGAIAFVLDIGAVIDPKPGVLLQFGYLGAAYASAVLGVSNPTVALLSNGEESSKGNALTRSARELLEQSSLNFVGYVEGRDMLHRPPSVTVTDGFTGNIALKVAEGTASGIQSLIKRELMSSWRTKVLAMMLRPTFRQIRKEIDFEGIGGAPLLGVRGVVFVAHGHSTPLALVNAIRSAAQGAEVNLPALLQDAIPRSTDASEIVTTEQFAVSP